LHGRRRGQRYNPQAQTRGSTIGYEPVFAWQALLTEVVGSEYGGFMRYEIISELERAIIMSINRYG
jgi:hypothetical protein